MSSRSCRVLLVEDNPDEAVLFSAALARAEVPWSLRVATGRREAVRALSIPSPGSDNETWSQPDVVVLDLQLGDESGFHVLRWIRTHHETRGVPVIVFTAVNDPGLAAQAEEYGCNRFVTKPSGIDTFVEIIRELHGTLCRS
jgi:CheY-like chemotaxis protein